MSKEKEFTEIKDRPVTHAFITAFVPWAKQLKEPFTGTAREIRKAIYVHYDNAGRSLRDFPQRDGHVTHVLMGENIQGWLRGKHRIKAEYARREGKAAVWTITPPEKLELEEVHENTPILAERDVHVSVLLPKSLRDFIIRTANKEGRLATSVLVDAILHYKADIEQTGEPTININNTVLTREDLEAVITEAFEDSRERFGKDDSARIMEIREEIGNMAEVHQQWNREAKEHRELLMVKMNVFNKALEGAAKSLATIQEFVERTYERVKPKWWHRR